MALRQPQASSGVPASSARCRSAATKRLRASAASRNAFERGAEWFGRTGIYPMHSLLVVRDDVLAERPGIANALYEALSEGKRRYLENLDNGTAGEKIDDRYRKQQKVVGDPLPYGLKANKPTLEALMGYAVQQRLITRALPVEDLFVNLN